MKYFYSNYIGKSAKYGEKYRFYDIERQGYLNDYIYTNLAKWGSEFEYESVLSEIGYEE